LRSGKGDTFVVGAGLHLASLRHCRAVCVTEYAGRRVIVSEIGRFMT